MDLAKQHGMEAKLAEAFNAPQDNQNDAALRSQVAKMQTLLAKVADPEFMRQQFTSMNTEDRTMSDVETFAANAEHWGAVEPHMPNAITFAKAKLGESASASDVLEDAYKLAVSQFVPKAEEPAPAVEATLVDDPLKAQAAAKAKSINLKSTVGKKPAMSEEEALSAAYDHANRA